MQIRFLPFAWRGPLPEQMHRVPAQMYRELAEFVNNMTSERSMTVTEIWQRMVAAGLLEGSRNGYKEASRFLARARQRGLIDSSRIRQGRGRFGLSWGGDGFPPKFKVGDRVMLRIEKCPQWMREGLRLSNPRTIHSVGRLPGVPANGYVCYFLGCNRIGSNDLSTYPFRFYQLIPWQSKGSPGRPRAKRHYNRMKAHNRTHVPIMANHGLLVDSVQSPSISCANGNTERR